MKSRRVMGVSITTFVLLGAAFAGGCSGPYLVTDPASGRQFYTKKVDRNSRGGYIEFTDAVTGSEVTLQSSEVKEISSSEFQKVTAKPK